MCKKFIPYVHAQSIYEIAADFYKDNNIKNVFIDLDNTLDSYRLLTPSKRAFDLINSLKEAKLCLILVSNNVQKRVEPYAKALNIDFIYSVKKPFSKKLIKYLASNNLNKDETVLIGDQLMTDVLAAKGAGIRSILTEKIVKEDQWTTHFNRLIDRPIRARLRKKGLLTDWRNKYGQK